jgi:geranylgeranyl diphosphate synthase type I
MVAAAVASVSFWKRVIRVMGGNKIMIVPAAGVEDDNPVGAAARTRWDTCRVTEPVASSPLGAPQNAPLGFIRLRDRFDDAIGEFLRARRGEIEWSEPDATSLIDEIDRLIRAGGKRLRPAFCYWGHRAVGGADDEPIIRASAALELLHTMALVHDDLMDGSQDRRGVQASRFWLAEEAGRMGLQVEPDSYGWSAAMLVGDLATVLADQLFLEAGFPPAATIRALERYHRMRCDMAVGQYLDIAGLATEKRAARRAAVLKGGTYTVEGPLLIGAALGGGAIQAVSLLSHYGAPLGEAFQLRDDIEDREGDHGATAETVNALVDRAVEALDPSVLDAEAVGALIDMAELVAMR